MPEPATLFLLVGNSSLRWRTTGAAGVAGRAAVSEPPPAEVLRLAAQMPCRVASVNPPRLARLEEELRRSGAVVTVLGRDAALPIRNDTRRPEQVGVDRLLAALGAWHMAGTAVVADMGTAITVDLVTDGPVFRGGAILPGPQLWAESLRHGTALLPAVSLEAVPESPLGRTTEEAIRSGLAWGTIGAVRTLIDALRAEAHTAGEADREPPACALIVTGGASALYLPYLHADARHEPDVIFRGMESACGRP